MQSILLYGRFKRLFALVDAESGVIVFLLHMKRALTVLFLLIAASPAFAADKWLSVHFKNFVVVGNAGEADIRRVGRSLEEFRSALAVMFPKMATNRTRSMIGRAMAKARA